MEKKYILEGLDCLIGAIKIEKALNKREEVNSASVNAATLGCTIQYKDYSEEIERKLIHLIEELEEVHVVEKRGMYIMKKRVAVSITTTITSMSIIMIMITSAAYMTTMSIMKI